MRSRKKTTLRTLSFEGEVDRMKTALVKSNCPAKTIGKVLNIKIDSSPCQTSKNQKLDIPSLDNKNKSRTEDGRYRQVFLTEGIPISFDDSLSGDQKKQESSKLVKEGARKGIINQKNDNSIAPNTPFEIALQNSQSALQFDYHGIRYESTVQTLSSCENDVGITKEIKTHYRRKRLMTFRDALDLTEIEGNIEANQLMKAYTTATSSVENISSRLHSKKLESTECMGNHLKRIEQSRNWKMKRKQNQNCRGKSRNEEGSGCEKLGRLAGMLSRRQNEVAITERDTCEQKQKHTKAAHVRAQKILTEQQVRFRHLQTVEQKRQDAFNMRMSLAHDLFASQLGITCHELIERVVHQDRDQS